MRKSIIMAAICLFLSSSLSWAAGTVTQTKEVISEDVVVITFTCVGDVSSGSIPNTDISTSNTNALKGFYLFRVETVYGSTGPTDNSDVYLKDANLIDVLGGAGVDKLDNATLNSFYPLTNSNRDAIPLTGTWTLSVTNQSVASATYTIKLYFVK